jgi:hypothetical protein
LSQGDFAFTYDSANTVRLLQFQSELGEDDNPTFPEGDLYYVDDINREYNGTSNGQDAYSTQLWNFAKQEGELGHFIDFYYSVSGSYGFTNYSYGHRIYSAITHDFSLSFQTLAAGFRRIHFCDKNFNRIGRVELRWGVDNAAYLNARDKITSYVGRERAVYDIYAKYKNNDDPIEQDDLDELTDVNNRRLEAIEALEPVLHYNDYASMPLLMWCLRYTSGYDTYVITEPDYA